MAFFADDILTDLDAVFYNTDEFAVTGVYSDGSRDIDISVIIDAADIRADRAGITAVAYVKAADVQTPGYRHTITVDGVTWTVDQEKHGAGYRNDGLVWQLPVIRGQRATQWRI